MNGESRLFDNYSTTVLRKTNFYVNNTVFRYEASVAGKHKQSTTPHSHSPAVVRYDTTVGTARNSFNISTVGNAGRAQSYSTPSPVVPRRETGTTPPSTGSVPLKSILRTSNNNGMTMRGKTSDSDGKEVERRSSSVPPQRPASTHHHSMHGSGGHNNNSGTPKSGGLGATLLASRQQQQHQQQPTFQFERVRSATPPGRSTQGRGDTETHRTTSFDFAKEVIGVKFDDLVDVLFILF